MNRALGSVVVFYALLAGAGLLWMFLRGDPLPAALLSIQYAPALAIGIGVAAGAVIVALSDVVLDRFEWTELLRDDVVAMLGPMTRTRAVVIALASGIGEEVLFRGAILPFAGLALSSIVFGALHTGKGMLGWTLFAITAGFAFGGLAVWTGGVLAPAVAHAVINGTQLWRLRARE